jgi:integrase
MATGSIRKRNGRFYVRMRVLVVDPQTGEARWKQTERAAGASRRKAECYLRSLQRDVDDGLFMPSGITVLELGRRWLAEHVEPNLKAASAANYKGTFYRHIAPALGSVRVEDCKPQMVRALIGRMREEGMSDETVAKIRRHIHAMFAFAQDAGLVSVNPANAPRVRGHKQSQRRARGTQLSLVQIKNFLDECSPRWRPFFAVALDTGLRRGELIGLRWGDIDLLQRILYVRRSIGQYDGPEDFEGDEERLTTKTEAGERLVPILDGAQAALEVLYANAADTSDDAPVFVTVERKPGRDGIMRPVGRPLSPRMVTRVFRRYAERAGLADSVRLHDLRHTAITNAIGQGEDILLVSAFAGHAKTSTTVDVYGHLMPDRVREAARRMRSVSGTFDESVPVPTEMPAQPVGPLEGVEALASIEAEQLEQLVSPPEASPLEALGEMEELSNPLGGDVSQFDLDRVLSKPDASRPLMRIEGEQPIEFTRGLGSDLQSPKTPALGKPEVTPEPNRVPRVQYDGRGHRVEKSTPSGSCQASRYTSMTVCMTAPAPRVLVLSTEGSSSR